MRYFTKVTLALSLGLAALPVRAYNIPSNVQTFYDKHKVRIPLQSPPFKAPCQLTDQSTSPSPAPAAIASPPASPMANPPPSNNTTAATYLASSISKA